MNTYTTTSVQETRALGERIGRRLKGGEIILLSGDLGAGKTVFTKGVAAGLESLDPVVSPSFTLVNIYKARLDIVHVDLYRLDSQEVWGLGLEDYMDQGHIVVVEWGDVARAYFKGDCMQVKIEYLDETSRRITVDAPWFQE